jgi:hypothetical protein
LLTSRQVGENLPVAAGNSSREALSLVDWEAAAIWSQNDQRRRRIYRQFAATYPLKELSRRSSDRDKERIVPTSKRNAIVAIFAKHSTRCVRSTIIPCIA